MMHFGELTLAEGQVKINDRSRRHVKMLSIIISQRACVCTI